ncbi:hypothetical protein [Yinghuangia soli]|uniref:Lipoprotein n=1 Tax=Yinghuangia soli TaxID=2908204 RepID=A0AA41U3M3_9ACTN|nr:hypothetical protein [Yinghuangia soli]MCF2529877.1 hypothetical protein [Yinghuangia soli]
MHVRRIALSVSAAFLAVAALGACSDDKGEDKTDNTKTDAKTLADQSIAEMDKLEFVQADGTGTADDGKPASASMCAVMKTKAVSGSVTIDGHKLDVIAIDGAQYMRGAGEAWAYLLGKPDDARIVAAAGKVAGDKYIKSPAEDKDDQIVDFFDGKTDTVTKGEVTDFKGQKVVPLSQTGTDGEKKTYYVAAEGKPLIVGKKEEAAEGPERQETVFTKAGSCVVKAPGTDQVIDADTFDTELKAELTS